MFNLLTSLRIKKGWKSTSVITMKNTDDFHYEGKLSRTTDKLTLFTIRKDEWDTKEDTGKSMKNTMYVLQYAIRHEMTLNSKNQAHSLSLS